MFTRSFRSICTNPSVLRLVSQPRASETAPDALGGDSVIFPKLTLSGWTHSSFGRRNPLICFFGQSQETLSTRRDTIAARQQNIRQPLVYTVVVPVIHELLYAFTVGIEPNNATSQVMKPPECILTEPHASQSFNRSATIARVPACLPATAGTSVCKSLSSSDRSH